MNRSKDARFRYVEIVYGDISLVISRFLRALSFGRLEPWSLLPQDDRGCLGEGRSERAPRRRKLNVVCILEVMNREFRIYNYDQSTILTIWNVSSAKNLYSYNYALANISLQERSCTMMQPRLGSDKQSCSA